MIESTGDFIKRKISDTGSHVYRKAVFPFVKCGIERRFDSILGKGTYLYKKTVLEGKNFIGDRAELANVRVGYGSFIGGGSVISNTRIGRYSCIAGLQTAIGRHPVKGENIAVHPAFYSTAAQYGYTYVDETSFEEAAFTDRENGYNITIGSDVWIGRGVTITDGVTIGDGAVVGAGSLVIRDIEPYAIYAGVPAKKIGSRFDDEMSKKLLKWRWWDKDEEWIRKNAAHFADPAGFFQIMEQENDT